MHFLAVYTLGPLTPPAQDRTELALACGGAAASNDGVPAPDRTFSPGPFANFPGPCTHLWDPSLFTVSGLSRLLNKHPRVSQRTSPDDALFVVAFPSLNIDEMVEVADLYEDTARDTGRPIVVVNGELERIRSGYYPAFWSRKEMAVLLELTPKFEQVYFIHNFKGSTPAVLFRAYPGPFQVLLNVGEGGFVCVHSQDTFPGLKTVALDILPKAIAARRAKTSGRPL
jgi:hypothetical protein